jgi:hypothetical protein
MGIKEPRRRRNMATNNYLLALIMLLSVAANCVAATANHSLDPSARTVAEGREVRIAVAQSEMKGYILDSNWSVAGGLLLALVDSGVESSRSKAAEKAIMPLRAALTGYDFDSKAQSTAEETFRSLDWFGATAFGFGKVVANAARSAQLDETLGQEMAFIDYEYGMSANFDAVELNINIVIASKHLKPNQTSLSRLNRDNLLYRQWHRVVVPLQGAGKKKEANVLLWSANEGSLAKHALEIALTKSQSMVRRGLLISASDANTLNKGKYTKIAGYGGFLLERGDEGTLIWAFGLDQWVLVTAPIS